MVPVWRALLPGWSLTRPPLQAGGNPFANMGGLMDNIKKAQAMVQVEAAKVQEELSRSAGGRPACSLRPAGLLAHEL